MAPGYLLALVVALLLFASLGQGYATVEVDHVLSGMFGAVAATVALGETQTRNRCALIPTLFCMPLIKTIGVLPALCAAAAVFAVDVLKPLIVDASRGRSWTSLRRPLVIACILLLVPLAAQQSWAARVRSFNFNQTFSVKFDVASVLTLATPSRRTPTQHQVVENFGRAFQSAPVGRNGNGILSASGAWQGRGDRLPPSTALQWLVAMSVLSLIVYAVQPAGARARCAALFLMLGAGCVGYILLLLYVYVFSFESHEGIRVTSFGRYVSTWFLAWGLVLAAALGQAARGTGPKQVAGLLLLVAASAWATVRAPHHDPGSAIFARSRAAIQATTAPVQGRIPPGAGTYIVWQQTEGFQFNVVAYELSPRSTNSWCWTLGEKYHRGDAWTCPLSAEEFAVRVKDFDYLLLMQGDDQFWKRYGSLFAEAGADDERKSKLFHINRTGGSIRFSRVAVP
jgi:hypothetical protein